VYDNYAQQYNLTGLKNQANALGYNSSSSCSVQEKALSDLQATQRAEIATHALAKQALLNTALNGYNPGDTDADTRYGVCTTYGTTLIGYNTELANLVIADDPVEKLKVQDLASCYSLLIAGGPAVTPAP